MNSHKSIFKILIVVFCLFIGGIVTQMDASAYFNPKVKKSSNGNWMQCYALQYEKKTGGGTFLGGAQIGHVASTDRLCAYVNSEGKMVTGNVSLASNPSGTASLKVDLKGKGNPKVYFDVKNKKKINFYQCNDGSLGSECYSELAKSWNTKKGDNFEELAKEINDFANEKYGDYTKMVLSNNSNSGSLTQDLSTEAGSNENNDEDGSSEIIEDCANQGGAQSLGWIICPIMSLLGDAAEGLYNSAVEPALNIEPKLFSDSDTNTAGAWGLFRNIANIIFVILMLLVIFSQLTGDGIDNYGIKKILPKLIVVAVLTNLSYVLCVLAIDVSNILGNSFQGLFEGMRGGLNLTLDFNDGTVIGNQIKSTAYSMVGVGVLSALVGMSGAIWQSPMVALSLLLGAIGVVISIFFLFVLLAAREAAIVVLVVLAPVAMVLYALPNTKKVFDKWLKAFEGLLLVYPIAGLLVGGGNYVSALLIHSGMGSDFFGALTAMIAGVLPIFFIPTMLKGSFSALGTIGARISGFGAGASKGVTRALGNSGVYKNAQESARRWSNRAQAGVDKDGKVVGNANKLIRGGRWGMGAARMRYLKDLKETGAVDNITTDSGFESAIMGVRDEERRQRSKDVTQQLYRDSMNDDLKGLIEKWNVARGANEDGTRNANGTVDGRSLDGYTNVIHQRFGAAGANAIADQMAKMDVVNNERDRAAISTLQQTMSDNSAFAGDMRNKAADAYAMINNNGLSDGNPQNLSAFAKENKICTTAKDWSTQSASTLQRAIDNGRLDDNMINALLNSTAPDIQSGIQTDQDKVRVLQSGLKNRNGGGASGGGTSMNVPHNNQP